MNNDLISRSELKKTLCEDYEAREHYIGQMMLKAIDNAPTVDVESVKSELNPTVTCWYDFDRGYEKGYEKAKKELEERPQGEWVYHSDDYIAFYTCNRCNGFGYKDDKFCNNCGADMRKGDTE